MLARLCAFCVCLIGGVVASGAVSSPLVAEQSAAAASAPDVRKLGPQVGDKLPAFSLRDQTGRARTLESLMGPKGLMLTFSRSASWCPYCKTQLVEMQGRLADVRQNGYELAVITYDPVPVLAEFAARRQITFPLLSDAGSAVIKRYGLLNTAVDPSNNLFGYPFPGMFIVDRQGVVTSRFFEDGYQERNTMSSVLVRMGSKVNVPATKVSSPNVEITSYTTDQAAASGTHFSIVLDITPAPRVHVYAPGVTGYKPIVLTVKAKPGLVVRAAQYPKSEDYHFKPLDEHVQVYQKPFRIVQDVMIDPSAAGQAALKGATSVTIEGILNYQACDDKVCFNPQTVPLTWTVSLKALDRERAPGQ